MELWIRPASSGDTSDILRIYAPFVEQTAVSFEEEVPGVEEMASRIETTMKEHPWLVCEYDGRIAGYAYASGHRNRSAYRWTKELSVYIDPDYKRRKIGKVLYQCVIDILDYQGICSVLAGITLPNPESVGFHEHMGFKKTAEFHSTGYKLGEWYDVGWWELTIRPGCGVPVEKPVPFPDIPREDLQKIIREATSRLFL